MKRLLLPLVLALLAGCVSAPTAHRAPIHRRVGDTQQTNFGTGAGIPFTGSITAGHCADWQTGTPSPVLQDSGGACGGSPNFSTIGAGTNTNALVIGAAGSLTYSSTGTINANQILGTTFPALVGSDCLASNSGGTALVFQACGGSSAFSSISSGSNSTAAMTLATGSSFTDSIAGAASTAAMTFTGAPYAAGTGTTNFPLVYLNAGVSPTTFSTAGTEVGINAPSGFTGNFFDDYVNGVEQAEQDANGALWLWNYTVNGATVEPQIHPLSNAQNVSNFLSIGAGLWNIGSATGTAQCNPQANFGSNIAGDWFFTTVLYVGGNGDFQVCTGQGQPVFGFVATDNTAGDVDVLYLKNSALDGPEFIVQTAATTGVCGGVRTALLASGPCTELAMDAGSNSYPGTILWAHNSAQVLLQSNLDTYLVGNTASTSLIWGKATWVSSTQETLALGDPTSGDTSSTATLQSAGNSVVVSSTGTAITGAASVSAGLTTNITGSTQCVQASSAGLLSGTGGACGGSPAFSSITSGTNTSMAAVLGSGSTLTADASTFLLAGSSTGTTAFASANAGASNFTLTFPAVTDTLAAIGTAQSWTAAQTFTNSDIKLLGSSTGATTFSSANASATNYTLTFPAVTDTLATIGTAQTWTAAQTFTNSDIKVLGSSTGATTFTSANASATNYTLTLPATTGTVGIQGTPVTFGIPAEAQASTLYFVPGFSAAVATLANAEAMLPFTGTLRNFYVQAVNTPPSGQTFTFTIMTGTPGTPTASTVTCQVTNSGPSCSDTSDSVSVTAGQAWTIKTVTSTTSGTTGSVYIGFEYDHG